MNRTLARSLRTTPLEAICKGIFAASAAVAIALLVIIVSATIYRGYSRISVSFIMQASKQSGLAGGILYQILGSLLLIGATAAIVSPFALSIATVVQTTGPRVGQTLRSILHIINATPSIVFGIVGFAVFTKILGMGKSWFAGSLILSLMILPTVTLALIHRMETIPKHYLETALGLGLNQNQLIKSVLLPYSWGGLLTGLVMGLARAFGETAPIMFTAAVFSGASLPTGIVDSPILALPYHLFNLAQDISDERAMASAWATAAVLLGLVLSLSMLVAPLRSKSHEEAKL